MLDRSTGSVPAPVRAGCFLAVVLVTALASSAESGPRSISEAERAAVEIAAHYLATGPSAIVERLSSTSPLRSLSSEDAMREIEVRAGPAAGATWEMQTVVPSLRDRTAVFEIEYPSGIDEMLVINLVREEDAWKVESLRSLAEPSPWAPPAIPDATADEKKDATPSRLPYILALAGAALAIGATVTLRYKPAIARLAAVGALALGIGGAALVWSSAVKIAEGARMAATAPEKPAVTKLASLLPLRLAIAAGETIPGLAPVQGDAANVARLWRAQVDLREMRLESAEKSLARFPTPSAVPLVELLRGRAAFTRFDDVSACRAYERAINLGPGRDSLWFEAAEVLSTLGFEDRSLAYLARLPEIGSRNAVAYYSLAAQAAASNDDADASVQLTRAWRLRPVPREKLVESPALWSVIRNSENLGETISLSSVSEPAFRSETARLEPIALPVGAVAGVTGEFLGVEIGGDRFLGVPGGAALVGDDETIVDALTWRRREEADAIADLPHLAALVRSSAALSQPSIRARLEKTTVALVSRGRWQDVVDLTEGLTPRAENVPFEVLMRKGAALSRTKRSDEAKKLYSEIVTSPAMKRRSDPMAYYQLGELMAAVDLYEPAMALLEQADAKLDFVSLDDRLRQLSMKQRLATAYRIKKTANFEIRFPDDVSPEGAARLGEILEAELVRIRKIVPLDTFEPVTVNVLWWAEFRSTFTGSDHIGGFYDGKITIPLAGVRRLEPAIVALVSHELAHAVIAQATMDRAPAWLQEGLAQRIEMVPYHANAFNMYEDQRLISVSLLDSVLQGSVDPDLIGEGYIEAQTLIRYIEAAHGRGGVQKLLAAYRGGADDEGAIAQLSGKPVAEFDLAFRSWGRAAKTLFENPPPVDYSAGSSDTIRFSKK